MIRSAIEEGSSFINLTLRGNAGSWWTIPNVREIYTKGIEPLQFDKHSIPYIWVLPLLDSIMVRRADGKTFNHGVTVTITNKKEILKKLWEGEING